jgi:hypothetical protein
MKCDSFAKVMPLYFYGELAPEEEDRLEEHLAGCPACREELERQRRLAAALDRHEVPSAATLLADCRHELMATVYDEAPPIPKRAPFEFWRLFNPFAMSKPLGALALVAVGFFAARFVSAPPSVSADAVFVKSVQPDSFGRVQIGVDETRRRMISGRLDDEKIQRLLLAAVKDESNPGVRVESMEILKSRPISPEVRSALFGAVLHDPNPGVRLKALEGLKSFASDVQTRKVLSQVLLTDDNPGLRIQAIDLLVGQRDDSIVGVLQNLVSKEENNYVRMRCRNALQEMNASVGTF